MEILRKESHIETCWASGTTTQIAIWPREASYAGRDFVWRVSAACVRGPESEFTLLPGVDRVLMVLRGRMTLTHDGGKEVALEPFDQDRFQGGSQTVCHGEGSDFNLMLRGAEGRVDAISMPSGQSMSTATASAVEGRAGVTALFYVAYGRVELSFGEGGRDVLREGDALWLCDGQGCTFENIAECEARLVRVDIFY